MRENKKKKQKRPKVNLILSHVNHTIFDIGPQAFRLTHCTVLKMFLGMQNGAIQGSICFKLVPRPLSKVALIYIKMQCSFIEPKPQKKLDGGSENDSPIWCH